MHQLPVSARALLLDFCDRSQLTLPLLIRHGPELPCWLRDEIECRAAKNRQRWLRVQSVYLELAGALDAEGIEYTVLKGFSFCPDFVPCPECRTQYDIDLLFAEDAVLRARDCTAALGYEPIAGLDRFPLDHLPTMIRKTGWEWRGDYFDPEIPVSVELHFRLWDARTEGFELPGLDAFRVRRVQRSIAGLTFPSLTREDSLAYCCLHILRHLLRGNLRPSHVYELAWFLEQTSADTDFWSVWERSHSTENRRVQAICFELANRWFECELANRARVESESLPAPVRRWFDEFSESPLSGMFRANKDELWLHAALLPSLTARARVIRRRLLPGQLPGPVDGVYVPDEQLTVRLRLRRTLRYASFLVSRLVHHAQAFPATIASGARWATGLGPQYWRFFATAALFDVGLFVFFLLYNVYLLRIGFNERFLGLVTSALTAGSIAGSLCAPPALARWGVRRLLLACLSVLAIASGLRALWIAPPVLIALAALCGACTGLWAVALAPTVAQLTHERVRPLAFSLIFGEGIGLGVIAGLLGGRLPDFFSGAGASGPNSLRAALLVGCGIVLLALLPLRRFDAGTVQAPARGVAKPNADVVRFLVAVAAWHLGTGAFNPFFNAFFVRMNVSVSSIGLLFSGSQLAQTLSVLAAPMVLRAMGLVRGVAIMQAATAAALVLIALGPTVNAAAVAYIAYMAFQYMSEPGIYSYLMNASSPESRTTASAMNFVVAFGAQAVASGIAGVLIARFGYNPLIFTAALLCGFAAVLFVILLQRRSQPLRSHP